MSSVLATLQCRRPSEFFSTIPIDQAHEQNNSLVKGDGGAVGLTETPSAATMDDCQDLGSPE